MPESFPDIWIELLTKPHFQKALIGGSVVAVVCSVVGCLVILRRMAFLGDALSHAMIAGVVSGYLFMKVLFGVEANAPAMLVGAILATIITVTLIGFVSKASRLKQDAVIGIMYCGVFAAGVVLLTIFQHQVHIDIMHFVMGEILGISEADLWMSVLVAGVVLSVIILFFRYFLITSFDPVLAASIGIPVLLFEYILTTCMSFVVVSAVSMVGVILSVGLLITPAATAYLLTDRLNRMMIIAGLFGIASVFGGLFVSIWLDAAGGVSIMLFSSLLFVATLIVAPRYGLLAGWQRRRRAVPLQLQEDVMRAILKLSPEPATWQALSNKVGTDSTELNKALRLLQREEFIIRENDQIRLTEKGRHESRRIMRAHRLWETYLHRKGEPLSNIHEKAHVLEHLHDEETVDFIDDLLGHPTRDPHGSLIPEDFVDSSKGMIAPVSLLRAGREGTVRLLRGDAADKTALQIGQQIRVGSRIQPENTWVLFSQPHETEIRIDHHTADNIIVQITN